MMIRRLYVAVALAMITGPACAINWAGHDDWLAGHPAAQALEEQGGRALQPPKRRHSPSVCQPLESVGKVPENPYEPIPPLCVPIPDGK